MKFDRNTIIGFVVLAGLFFGYFYYTNQEQATYRKNKAIEQARLDSIARANRPPIDSVAFRRDSARADSAFKLVKEGNFKGAGSGTEQIVYAENELFKVALTSKGGRPKYVELKKFKNMDSGHVRLAATDFDNISYTIQTTNGQTSQTNELFFSKIDSVKNADGSQTFSFALLSDSGSATSIIHKYTIRPNEYMIDFDAQLTGADKLLTQGVMNLSLELYRSTAGIRYQF